MVIPAEKVAPATSDANGLDYAASDYGNMSTSASEPLMQQEDKELPMSSGNEVGKMTDPNATDESKTQQQTDPPEVKGTENQGDVSGDYVFIKGGDANQKKGLYGKWVRQLSKPEIAEGYKKVQTLITEARKAGGVQAAANLQYWLDGGGGTYNPSFKWLWGVPAVNSAQKLNTGRFYDEPNSSGKSLEIIAYEMKKGEKRTFTDYWDAPIHVSALTYLLETTITPDLDFAYAFGGATLVSTGTFNLERIGNTVYVNGTISHNFSDLYDWEIGLDVTIAGVTVKDEDMKLMEVYKGAKPFRTDMTWTNTYKKNIEV